MLNRTAIEKVIYNYKEENDFTGKTSIEQIESTEDNLGVSFSNDYKWFLKNYGSGGVLGIDILGLAKNNVEIVVNTTNRLD